MIKDYFKAHVAVYLFLEKQGQILLHLRKNTGFADGYYSLVAGHIDGNETSTNAMIREAKEEAGITIKPQDLKVVHVMHRNGDKEFVDIFFQCSKWKGKITNIEPHKCKHLQFFDKHNLPENTLQYVKSAFLNSQSGIIYSEIGWK